MIQGDDSYAVHYLSISWLEPSDHSPSSHCSIDAVFLKMAFSISDSAVASNLHPRLRLLRTLRYVSVLEGASLLLLLFIGVPLKHWGHMPLAVTVLGPAHGLIFISYLFVLWETALENEWKAREICALVGLALVPFGSLATTIWVRRKIGEHVGRPVTSRLFGRR